MITNEDILQPGDDVSMGKSFIVYGGAGAGKTSLIKTLLGWDHNKGWGAHEAFCEPSEIFVMDVESGREVLVDDAGKLCCTVFPIREGELDRFRDMIAFVKEGKIKPKVVMVDNVSELEKFYTLGLTKQRGLEMPRRKEYGDASVYVRKHMRELRSLTEKDTWVIFTFWDKIVKVEDKEDTIISEVTPMCMSETWREYVGLVGHYAYMGIVQKKFEDFAVGERFLQFDSYGLFHGKTRSANIKKWEKANLADIFRRV